ncbi:MAG TPA: zinc-binding dehydrogenase [Trebonia sp.]
MFNGLRRTGAQPGDLVAILGIGGLGHLAVQFAAKMGFETVAIARGQDKKALAASLGAHHYVDSTSQDVAEELQALGGARAVLATVTQASAMNPAVGGLRAHGELVVAGASPDSLGVTPGQLIGGEKTVRGVAAGTASDIEATMRFAALSGIRPMVEEASLDDAPAAFARMLSGRARFRMVLTTGA